MTTPLRRDHIGLPNVVGLVSVGLLSMAIVGFVALDEAGSALSAALFLPMIGIGLLIVFRRRGHAIGWMLLLAGLGWTIEQFAVAYARYAVYQRALPYWEWIAWIGSWIRIPLVLLIPTLVFLLFPTGRLLSPRWRPVVGLSIGLTMLISVTEAFTPETVLDDPQPDNPARIDAVAAFVDGLAPLYLLMPLIILAAVASLVIRYRRARGTERQQLKWFTYAAVVATVIFVTGTMLAILAPDGGAPTINVVWFLGGVSMNVGIPVAIAIAILRYRLYDIDRLINRTLVYGFLTMTLALVYLGLVVGIGGILRSATGTSSTLVVAASTLAVAALFGPLRGRIQSEVDRHFYRSKYDAANTVEAFSAFLRDEIDVTSLTRELQAVIQQTMQPAHVSIWLRSATSSGGDHS